MKEKDLDKCLDNVIIDGLRKEAEQDNADLLNALRHIKDEDFESIIEQDKLELVDIAAESSEMPAAASIPVKKPNILRPWIISAISAAAVIALVLIPSYNVMNGRLCESALYMSVPYITAAKGGFDLSIATEEQIKEELPNLESSFESTIQCDGKFTHYSEDFDDAGWNLAVAYLKLHKKGDAVKILKELSEHSDNPALKAHCSELLKQLD